MPPPPTVDSRMHVGKSCAQRMPAYSPALRRLSLPIHTSRLVRLPPGGSAHTQREGSASSLCS